MAVVRIEPNESLLIEMRGFTIQVKHYGNVVRVIPYISPELKIEKNEYNGFDIKGLRVRGKE